MSSFEDDLRVEMMRMQDEHSRAIKALPEDTLLDLISKNLYECLGVVVQHSRMASQFLELARKGSFTRENIGVWNGLVQDVDCIVKHTRKARQRLRDMWTRTELRKNNRPDGQKG